MKVEYFFKLRKTHNLIVNKKNTQGLHSFEILNNVNQTLPDPILKIKKLYPVYHYYRMTF